MRKCLYCKKTIKKKNNKLCFKCNKKFNNNNTIFYISFCYDKKTVFTLYQSSNNLVSNSKSILLLFEAIKVSILLHYPIWIKSDLLKKCIDNDFKTTKYPRIRNKRTIMVPFDDIVGLEFYEHNDTLQFHQWIQYFVGTSTIRNPLVEVLCMN